MDGDQADRHPQRVLQVADGALRDLEHDEGLERPLGGGGGAAAAHEAQRPQRRRQQDPDRDGVQAGDVGQEEAEPLDLLVAAVGPGPGDGGAGDEDDGGRAEQHAGQDADLGGGHGPALAAVGLAGAVVQDDGAADEDGRHEEVAHHERGRQLVEDGEAAEDDLADDPGDERPGPPGQVAPAGGAEERAGDGQDHADGDQAGEVAVGGLDDAVHAGFVVGHERAGLAARPRGAAQAGSGEAHPSAGDHDDPEQRQREQGDPAVRRGGDRRATHPSSVAAPTAVVPGVDRRGRLGPPPCTGRRLTRSCSWPPPPRCVRRSAPTWR